MMKTKRGALGEVIKRRRIALKMSQAELAQKLAVSSSCIGMIEAGARQPSLDLIGLLADALGLNPKELLYASRPEVRAILSEDSEGAWGAFVKNRALLRRHKISDVELRILREVSLHSHFTSPTHYLHVIRHLRQAAKEVRHSSH